VFIDLQNDILTSLEVLTSDTRQALALLHYQGICSTSFPTLLFLPMKDENLKLNFNFRLSMANIFVDTTFSFNKMLIAMIEAGFPLDEPYLDIHFFPFIFCFFLFTFHFPFSFPFPLLPFSFSFPFVPFQHPLVYIVIKKNFSSRRFINAILHSMKSRYLQELRTRSRILIKDGCVLMGGNYLGFFSLLFSLSPPSLSLSSSLSLPLSPSLPPYLNPSPSLYSLLSSSRFLLFSLLAPLSSIPFSIIFPPLFLSSSHLCS
jgi:hypothetical protein